MLRSLKRRLKPVEVDINEVARELLVQARYRGKHKKPREVVEVVIDKQYSDDDLDNLVARIRELEAGYDLEFLRRHSGNTLAFTKK